MQCTWGTGYLKNMEGKLNFLFSCLCSTSVLGPVLFLQCMETHPSDCDSRAECFTLFSVPPLEGGSIWLPWILGHPVNLQLPWRYHITANRKHKHTNKDGLLILINLGLIFFSHFLSTVLTSLNQPVHRKCGKISLLKCSKLPQMFPFVSN